MHTENSDMNLNVVETAWATYISESQVSLPGTLITDVHPFYKFLITAFKNAEEKNK